MSNKIIQGDCLEILKQLPTDSVDSIVTDPPYELGFMGKKWDSTGIAYNVGLWKEALRVLKHGGHLLSFGGSRTYHRMASAIEDAGFEIRDQIMWVYGSGFPKSLNIGKAIDKLQGNERKQYVRTDGKATNSGSGCYEMNNGKDTSMQRIWKDSIGTSQYEGWGTALKPAHEPICMARKPLSEKTVAENVLKWGIGGINIDGSRIQHNEETKTTNRKQRSAGWNPDNCGFDSTKNIVASASPFGRFPANFIHDGSQEVMDLFPDTKSGGGDKPDQGSAARFFYCAKASRNERDYGLDNFDDKQKIYRATANGTGEISKNMERFASIMKNNHPTVKPIKLMQYLIKLVTPLGGIVLDPFSGSGSTLIAAKLLGFNYIGIELDAEYIKIAESRLAAV